MRMEMEWSILVEGEWKPLQVEPEDILDEKVQMGILMERICFEMEQC